MLLADREHEGDEGRAGGQPVAVVHGEVLEVVPGRGIGVAAALARRFGVEAGGKKPECCVTGGLGTSQVTYMGQTYWVCCTGCRDAFNENPAKVIADYMKKKKKG